MTRPSKTDVDYALDWFAPSFGGPGGVLAAEVRALREDADLDFRAHVVMVEALRAQLARVEALCHMQHEDSAVSIGDIRAALRGEP